jgi:hypothetical protein
LPGRELPASLVGVRSIFGTSRPKPCPDKSAAGGIKFWFKVKCGVSRTIGGGKNEVVRETPVCDACVAGGAGLGVGPPEEPYAYATSVSAPSNNIDANVPTLQNLKALDKRALIHVIPCLSFSYCVHAMERNILITGFQDNGHTAISASSSMFSQLTAVRPGSRLSLFISCSISLSHLP